ncbi:cyclohexanecarboxylate-CoA ligase [Rhodoligotrophos appendicifer]|uniref:AMP-binding protein n=1 Tax=Rhodoligotrophos appendicifer TaxID=987056 RepID=UPI00118018FB|nr:AMP-binding protein [Rhodoligotrophos appendicifer]
MEHPIASGCGRDHPLLPVSTPGKTFVKDARRLEYLQRGWWPNETIYDVLSRQSKIVADKTLIVDRGHRTSYGQAVEIADQLAAGLHRRGVGRGDVVSIQLPNWRWFPLLEYALARLGAACNPLPPIYRHRELRFMLGLVKPKLVITCGVFRGFDHTAMMADLRRELPLGRVIVVEGEMREGMESIEDLLEDPSQLPTAPVDPDSLSEVAFTSGTTGEAKGVMHTHNSNLCPVLALIRRQGLGADDVILMASTFGHNTGFVYGGQLPVVLGGTVVLMESWNSGEALKLITEEKVSWCMGATPFLQDLCDAAALRGREATSSLRVFLCSGAPIPRSLLAKARSTIGCAVVSGWGMTEIGLMTLSDVEDKGDQAADTDGHTLEGVAIRILDPEGNDASIGEEGDIVAKGPTLFAGYFDRQKMTEESFLPGGWFTTGDRGRVDEQGNLRITGRSKDIIVRGGENIPVVEIEDLLHKHPRIRNVVVIGIPDPRLQERACAVVIPADEAPLTLEELKAYLAEMQLAKQYFPEFLVIRESFPTTPSGKVQKFILRQELVASFAAASTKENMS